MLNGCPWFSFCQLPRNGVFTFDGVFAAGQQEEVFEAGDMGAWPVVWPQLHGLFFPVDLPTVRNQDGDLSKNSSMLVITS